MAPLLKCIWAALLPMAFFFIALNARSRFDRSFGYFGLAQLFLCAMTGIDLWILSEEPDPASALFWNRMMFPVGCLFAVFYFWYMSELTDWRRPGFIRFLAIYALFLCAIFSTPLMFRLEEGAVVRGPAYDAVFPGFMALCLFGALVLIFRRMRLARGRERHVLYFHLIGFLLLFVFGVLDVVFTYYIPRPFFVSFNTLGALAFGLSSSLIFLERFINLLNEKDGMHEKVRSAVRELEEARAMKRVGESVALLNHEIKNYAATISGNARLLHESGIPEEFRPRLERIRNASQSLGILSRDVLDLPGKLRMGARCRVDLGGLVEKCAGLVPESMKCAIAWSGAVDHALVHGDAAKLELVFGNLFRNAAEAGASNVKVRAVREPSAVRVTLEDDGKGCDEEALKEMGKAFYTTRRGAGGTGLGICVARAMMESHGGSLSLRTKNRPGEADTGLIVELTFPSAPDAGA